jgi:anthranilate synthase component 2
MKIMVLDNYDSFTYNLVHILKELSGGPVDVHRNDKISLDRVGKYDKILISPGPGIPDQAGITKEMISYFAATKSILGVCLGCQAIGEAFGGILENLDTVYHGVDSNINVLDYEEKLFIDIPANFMAGRYHSWIVSDKNFPTDLKITSKDNLGMIMSLAHRKYDVRGVQFHPESVLTKVGKQLLLNWLNN